MKVINSMMNRGVRYFNWSVLWKHAIYSLQIRIFLSGDGEKGCNGIGNAVFELIKNNNTAN